MGRLKPEIWINLGILIISGLMMLGAFAGWTDARYAKTSEVSAQNQEIHELKGEMDALYLHLIPQPEQASLKHISNLRDQ